MAQTRVLGVPLSERAKWRLWAVGQDYFRSAAGVVVISIAMCILVGSSLSDNNAGVRITALTGAVVCLVAIATATVLYFTKGTRRQEICEANALDWSRAESLRTHIFPRFVETRSDEFPLRESEVSGSWRPFKVEHFVSQSLRGDISGKVCIDLRALIHGTGQVHAQLRQLSVPDLTDMSSIVFLKNDRGETLRVLVPSPRAARETLARLIEYFIGRESVNSSGTHVHDALQQFTTDDQALLSPISHPEVLDRLDAATQTPLETRPAVLVIGEQIQKGVALATALVVDGVKHIFHPSGYLGELASAIALVLDQDHRPANILEAVK